MNQHRRPKPTRDFSGGGGGDDDDTMVDVKDFHTWD
jgi:hypothetical protein